MKIFLNNFIVSYYLFVYIFLLSNLLIVKSSSSSSLSFQFENIRFSNESYTGYLSENIALSNLNPSSLSSSSSSNNNKNPFKNDQYKRRNLPQTQIKKSIYIRFIDNLKPSIYFKSSISCTNIDLNQLNLTIKANEYDQEVSSLFEIDHQSFLCTRRDYFQDECLCFIKIRLTDDPTIRDRINREAKDLYQFQIKLNQITTTTTTINVNILDDNDLEPMFDPSEYNIDLNEFYIDHDNAITRLSLTEFSVIGRVMASDPDLAQNAKVKFYSLFDPYFGVNSQTGDIFIRKNLNYLFDTNRNEFQFEVKAIDSGVKLNLINTLLKTLSHNQSSFMNDLDDMNFKLIQAGCNYDTTKTSVSTSSQNSFESAQIKITLNRNLNTILSDLIEKFSLNDVIDSTFKHQIDLFLADNVHLQPFKLLTLKFKQSLNLNQFNFKINSNDSSIEFNMKKLFNKNENQEFYLIYFHFDLDLNQLKYLTNEYSISYCLEESQCFTITKFNFNLFNDLINSIIKTCTINLNIPSTISIDKLTTLNSSLFKPKVLFGSIYNRSLLCNRLLTYNDIFRIEYSLKCLNKNQKSILSLDSQSNVLIDSIPSKDYYYELNSYLYYNMTKLNLTTSQTFTIQYSNKYDSIYELLFDRTKQPMLTKVIYDPSKSAVYEFDTDHISILFCTLFKRDGSNEQNESLFTLINNQIYLSHSASDYFVTNYHYALLSIKRARSDSTSNIETLNLLVLNDFSNKIKIKLVLSNKRPMTNTKRVDSNILETPLQIGRLTNTSGLSQYEFNFNVLNETIDNKCFSINQSNGDLYLKCKIPFSFLNHNLKQTTTLKNSKSKISIGQNTVKRVLEVTRRVKATNQTETTSLEIYFDIIDQIKRLEEISLDLELVNYSFISSNIDYSSIEMKILNENKNRLKTFKTELLKVNLQQPSTNLTQVEYLNETFISLVYKIHNSSDCLEDKLIFKIDSSMFSDYNQENIYLFNLNKADSLFKLDRLKGYLTFGNEFKPFINTSKQIIKINITEFDLVNSKVHFVTIELNFKFELNSFDLIPLPELVKSNYKLIVDKSKLEKTNQNDLMLINSFKFKPDLTNLFNLSYSIRQTESSLYADLPFYIDTQNGQLFYFNGLNTQTEYKFQIVINFKFTLNDKLTHSQIANIKVNFIGSHNDIKLTDINKLKKSKSVISNFNLNVPVHSTELFMYFKTPLIGVLTLSDDLIQKYNFDIDKPKFRLVKPKIPIKKSFNIKKAKVVNRKTIRKKSIEQFLEFKINDKNQTLLEKTPINEQILLNENFLTLLYVDNQTGALYFNYEQESSINLFSKLAKLINFYYYERNMSSNLVKIDVLISNHNFNLTQSYWINLIFNKQMSLDTPLSNKQDSRSNVYKHKNNFKINSNNLLSMFRNGDEFLIDIDIEENSPTWLSLIDSTEREEGFIINLKEFFKSSLNLDKRNHLVYLNMLKNTRFYVADKDQDYFKIDDNSNGILLTSQSVQFDYEVNRVYLIKLIVVQYISDSELETDEANDSFNNDNKNSELDDLIFEQKRFSNQEKFVYYIDLNIRIKNLVDEPFICSEPIYYINVDENEIKNKKLLTIKIQDFDQNENLDESKFKAQILSGNAQGLFHMNDLSLFTGSSTRKLDRETRAQHELELKIIETNEKSDLTDYENFNSSRFALCKVVVFVNDINDNRPIVNDIELSIYDKLDSKLIDGLKIPIANAIAIDQDQFAKLTYSIVAIRIMDGSSPKRKARNTDFDESNEIKGSNKELDEELSKLFVLNTTTGSLYSTKTEMPCQDCIITIQYKANDVGRFKTRVSRKSAIKLNVKKFPISFFKINEQGTPEVEKLTTDQDQSKKTFELAFKPNRSSNIVILNLNEDIKLGEKIYQIKTKSKVILDKSIIYYHLIESTNLNQTFYLSNHDGSLYLIKPLDHDQDRSNSVFNLTVLITNWIGQIEYVYIEINVKDTNDNRAKFSSSVYDVTETIQTDLVNLKEKQIDLVNAYDLDDLDIGKLTFKLEDCFYIGASILLKKPYVPSVGTNPSTNHLNYPLCSKQFMELVWSPSQAHSQLVRLKMNLNDFMEYLKNSTDFYQSKLLNPSILFIMDISVKDSSSLSPGVARIRLNMTLERSNSSESNIVFKNRLERDTENDYSVKFGFKKSNYFVSVKTIEQLKKGAELLYLLNEFVWEDLNKSLNSFKPFDLRFYIKSSKLREKILIEPYFGLVYLNQTLFDMNSIDLINNEFIFEAEIGCEINTQIKLGKYNSDSNKLFKTTKILISILKSVLVNQIDLNDFLSQPIWKSSQVEGFVQENVPVGTLIKDNKNENELKISTILNTDILSQIQKLTPIQINQAQFTFHIKNQMTDLFELEAYTGVIRVKFEPDYELIKEYSLNIIVCANYLDSIFLIKTSSACFKQILDVKVNVLNRNDNEPKFKLISSNEYNLNLSNPSELLRSMTLFKFEVVDADGSLNKMTHEIVKVNSVNHKTNSNHRHHKLKRDSQYNSFSDLIKIDSFELFKLNDESNEYAIKITNLGYENLIRLSNKQIVFDPKLDNRFEIICQVNDGLFSNQITFELNLEIDYTFDSWITSKPSTILSIKNNPIAPILHTIEIQENIDTKSNFKLINIEEILINYLSSNLNAKNLGTLSNFDLALLNYENLFFIDKSTKYLFIRNVTLDREIRDTYELFIGVKNLNSKNRHLIPSHIRVLIKLTDLNDNRPLFIRPNDVKHTREIRENFDLFYFNRTYLWTDFINSKELSPILGIEAIDYDLESNSDVTYHINSSTVDLFSINQETGSIYFNQKSTQFPIEPVVVLTILARDNGKPTSLQSFLNIRFHFIRQQSNFSGVYFEQNYYNFKIVESFEPNKTIGYVNSARHFINQNESDSTIIYSIVDGDYYQEFKIDFDTGRLFLKSKLDYEFKSVYLLTIRAIDSLNPNLDEYSNATVRVELIDINDQEPKFDKFEYTVDIIENIPKMTEIFRLTASDSDSSQSQNSQIRFKLLNNLDLFYINEITGIVYNKQTFDYESDPRSYQLKIKAYDLGSINENLTFVSKSIDTACLLTINVLDSNDNSPEFDKSGYFSQIEIDDYQNNDKRDIYEILLDESSIKTRNSTFQFVTKVNAKDIDSSLLEYSILKQSYLIDQSIINSQIIEDNLFSIDSKTGLVYLNTKDFDLFKKFIEFLNPKSKQTTFVFNLQILVSDSRFTNQARLNIQVKDSSNLKSRPKFSSNFIKFNLNLNNNSTQYNHLVDLRDLLEDQESHNQLSFSINLETRSKVFELFQIDGDSNLNIKSRNSIDESMIYEIPILACDIIQIGFCDQILMLVNLTNNLISNKHSEEAKTNEINKFKQKIDQIGFSYKYGVFTIQQQFGNSADYPEIVEPIEENEDDYYNDETYESSERFYFELKTLDFSTFEDQEEGEEQEDNNLDENEDKKNKNKNYKYEFDIISCSYSNLNLTLTNVTLAKQIKQFTLSKNYFQLTPHQTKTLFLLNKHNGVLSSRKIINYMLPGIYMFNISLRINNKMNPNQTIQVDTTQFKLAILPSVSSLKNTTKFLTNNFKFDKEFFKFKFNQTLKSLGQIKLVNKHSKNGQQKHKISYRLIENKFKELDQVFNLDSLTGELSINKPDLLTADLIRPNLNEDNLLILYALATVKSNKLNNASLNQLEYMCEIHIDFNQFLSLQKSVKSQNVVKRPESVELNSLTFGKSSTRLKINENIKPETVLYRLMALTGVNLIEQRSYLVYSIENEQEYFGLDQRNGLIRTIKEINKETIKNPLFLNISACIDLMCTYTQVLVDLIDTNNQAPIFESNFQDGTIREDALPGTVVATLKSKDQDLIDGSKLEYFILNGDLLNQFAVSSDGKVYTRLMLDREVIQNYVLSIIVFDGKFKMLTKLNIRVLNVDDSRPICSENLVRLNLSENAKLGDVIYNIKATNLDTESNLKYELVPYDQIEGFSKLVFQVLPFGIHENSGSVYITDSIDYEYKKSYKFYVRVFKSSELSDIKNSRVSKSSQGLDWISYCLVKFEIKVIDENDNRPEFKATHAKNLLENSPKGTIIGVYEAFDLDSKINSIIYYSIVNETTNSLFKIDQTSGLIQLDTNNLDREKYGDSIELKIRGSNVDNLSSEFNLKINIIDVNDNKPIFEREDYYVSVQENLPSGFVITELKATDKDVNSLIEYFLLVNSSSPGSEKFLIERKTGKVILNGSIDFESQTQFVLEIIAVDPHLVGENSSKTRLTIDVIDLNDNPPIFDPSTPTDLYIYENTPSNTTIYTLKAFDNDKSYRNNKLSYKVIEGSEFFEIDLESGRLYNKFEFDYEKLENKNFQVQIECFDNGERESLKARAKLAIHVMDQNDNEPVFLRKNQTIIFKDSFPLGQEITRFNVTDLDTFSSDPNIAFTFVIIEQFKQIESGLVHLTEPIFSINPNGSLILVKKPFSNQTYFIRLRCYDTGIPAPLYSDTYLTIKVTDELNNEPKMSDYSIEVITLENVAFIQSDQIISEIKATDPDKKDTLFYELNDSIFEINKLTGLLKTKKLLSESANFNLRPTVTDKKFNIESNVNILIKQVKRDCLFNSLYAKFIIWSANSSVTLENFSKLGYLKRFKENVHRLLIPSFKTSPNLSIEIIGLRYEESLSKEDEIIFMQNDEFDSESQESVGESKPNLIEVLFIVNKVQSNNKVECLASKFVSKILNKKKLILIKRLRVGQFKLKLADLSFNHECKNSASVCSTNIALQTCQLRFVSFNQYDLCEQLEQSLTKCQLIPKHSWTCEALENRRSDSDEIFDAISTTNSPKSNGNEGNNPVKYGLTCKKGTNPCKNNGICKMIKSTSRKLNVTRNRLHCFCPNGWKGKFCDEDINECNESEEVSTTSWVNPCHSSAKCLNTIGSYVCNCTLEPSSLCYNTLSPQYSASVADLKDFSDKSNNLRNLKYLNSVKKFQYLNDQDEIIDLDDFDSSYKDQNEDLTSHITLFGAHIPNHVIQQALLGIFGGICAILILLSLAAGVVCKINLSRTYSSSSNSFVQRHDKLDSTIGGCGNTSNTSVDHDAFSSSTSSPCSYNNRDRPVVMGKPVSNTNKYKNSRFSRNKQRSSMTTSLLSSNTIESTTEAKNQFQKVARKNFKYSINNLLFAKLNSKASSNKLKELDENNKAVMLSSQECSSLAEVETSSAYSPQSFENGLNTLSLAKYKINKKQNLSIVESSCLLESNENKVKDANDADDESCFNNDKDDPKVAKINSLIRPVNLNLLTNSNNTDNFSSFGRSSFKTKFNTLNLKPSTSSIDFEKVKFNTATSNKQSSSNSKNKSQLNLLQQKQSKQQQQQQHTTFLPTTLQTNQINENNDKDESLNEDCSLGFYWDITDWAGGIASISSNEMQKLSDTQTINTNINHQSVQIDTNINSTLSEQENNFSPIYSKVFKVNSKNKIEKFDDLAVSNLKLDDSNYIQELDEKIDKNNFEQEDDELVEEAINKKLSTFQTNNYMFLTNKEDCDKTFESTNTNTCSQINDDENNHYFMPFFKTNL